MSWKHSWSESAAWARALPGRVAGRLRRDLVDNRSFSMRRYGSILRAWLRGFGRPPLDGRPVVVFHKVYAKHREYNQAAALRSTGRYQTVLFAQYFDFEEMEGAFDEVHFCANPGAFVRQLSALARRASIHSVLCGTQTVDYAQRAMDTPRDWPVLINQYDSAWATDHLKRAPRDFGEYLPASEIAAEKDAFPRCDGVIGRFRALNILFEEQDVRTPLITRWDLCDRRRFAPIESRPPSPDGALSVVVAGLVWPMNLPEDVYGEGQLVRYAADFQAERVHLHVYPSPYLPFHCPQYEKENRENPFFHLHASVPASQSPTAIAAYDLGWMVADCSRSALFSDRSVGAIIPLRFFGLLEAGLPIVCAENMASVADLVRKYDCGVVLPRPSPLGLRKLLEAQDFSALRSGVARAREALETLNHVDDFVAFLEEVRERWSSSHRSVS
ncbi:MAG: hypothetical protein HY303_19655 [Candidatus Wallbacteria bacterium]|nr:hypothetical protein [Candidatus Wallbacteria bacterium]